MLRARGDTWCQGAALLVLNGHKGPQEKKFRLYTEIELSHARQCESVGEISAVLPQIDLDNKNGVSKCRISEAFQ